MNNIELELDAFIRSLGINRNTPHSFLLGAGASISSEIPSAERCIWEWKQKIFLTNNPGLEQQFSELSLSSVRVKIQQWLDRRGNYPALDSPDEYGFYIEECFPIQGDRKAYFQEKVRNSKPHIGYQLLCLLAQQDFVRAVWTTNFDGLVARSAANFPLTTIEVGIDSQERLPRVPQKGELLCVSLHGDYRYDYLKNTASEIQNLEAGLSRSLKDHLIDIPLIVIGYSGRDASIMEELKDSYTNPGTGSLYWCGYAQEPRDSVVDLIESARKAGRQAYYVPSQGFYDLLVRLSFYCLEGEFRKSAEDAISATVKKAGIKSEPFSIDKNPTSAVIKSNAFEIECPAELLQFDLKTWPDTKVWSWLREQIASTNVLAVPFRGKVLALGFIDDIKATFGDNIEGHIERTPVSTDDLRYDDGAITSLMREGLIKALASQENLESNGRDELWFTMPLKTVQGGGVQYRVHESALVFLRRIGGTQYLILKPSLRVLDLHANKAPPEIANPIKLSILGWQHNKPFNQAMNKWRNTIFTNNVPTISITYPPQKDSTFRYQIKRSPIFAEIQSASRRQPIKIANGLRPLLKQSGFELNEPSLVFSNKDGTIAVKDIHPIRGILNNRPYDYTLTMRGLVPTVKLGVICPKAETKILLSYLHTAYRRLQPSEREKDYLIDYPGFEQAYGLPLEIPEPGMAGWVVCPEPSASDSPSASRELGGAINRSIEVLESSFAPSIVLIFFPDRWAKYREYKTDDEQFDLHDFVKAFSVQRGVATQFLNQSTLRNQYQCRVWWWLSLAFYVKSMRTPWVLDSMDEDTAFVGLGFSVDLTAQKGAHVVLGCSHIYSARGEGLQYRLSKIEEPVFYGKNPFMSKDDARRLGETIRYLFYDSRLKLPKRVVIHKRTPFLKEEREGLFEGLSGVAEIDLLEIYIDHALRYVASEYKNGKFDEDNYPVRRGTTVKIDDYIALIWIHGVTVAVNQTKRYYQGKRRIPAPMVVKRHTGRSDLRQLAEEILGLSKMNWNTFDLYTKMPATVHSSNEIARIGSLLQRFGRDSYDFRLFM